ncbi:MAG: Uma2 family endonuclease [Bacteroidota bacterium]
MTKQLPKELIASVLRSPEAPTILKELQEVLEKEQERRRAFYNTIPTEENKTEFINGEVIIQSPVKRDHNIYSGLLYQLINVYVNKNDLGLVGIEKIMVSLTRNDYEPDICFFIKEKAQNFESQQSLFPAPDFVVEIISKKTADRDRGIKYTDYQNHGVEEYWIIHPEEKTVEQYLLQEGQYQLQLKSNNGEIASQAIKGFKIPILAIFDTKVNLEVMAALLK